ncbi:MAG TPA: betaine--homocysteine S-methyltransferase [Bauldia sp.]|nr:betaine--homocysteine S-methyltransferase [Bauldia sp.]
MRTSLEAMLAARPVLLADGATGTNLFNMGLTSGDAPEFWNETHPDRIKALHQSFVDAGADIILTNTFGANRRRLALHKAEDRARELNRIAAENARAVADAAERPVVVAGSVGPTGDLLAPLGPLTEDEAEAVFAEQIAGLKEGGADVVWIETMSALEEIRAAARAAAKAGMPFTTTASFDTAGKTMMGVAPAALADFAVSLPDKPLALGGNCGVGASDLLVSVLAMTERQPDAIVIAKANCGIPTVHGDHTDYSGTPETMAEYARLAMDAGARIIGGCCGTSPAHLAAMRKAIDGHARAARPSVAAIVERVGPLVGPAPEADDGKRAREGRRGREARREARLKNRAASVPYITRNLPVTEVLDEEGLAIIEGNAERILEEVGIEFKDYPSALERFRAAGADVKGSRVRFPRGLARHLCATCPEQFTQVARNPARSVPIGGKATVFAPVYGSPFVHDLDRGRRYGTIEDFQNFVKLAYQSPYIHHSGGTVCEPVDLPVNKRHLEMVYAHMRWSDKPYMGSVTRPERAEDTVAMSRILFGEKFLEENVVVMSLINANSPLVWDSSMLGAAEAYARANQALIMTPFILSGAMSPVTVAGTLSQVLAEVLAGTAFVQLVRPGAPVVFGTFVSTLSMQSGAPTFGTPEAALAIYGAAQLARRMKMPFRTGGSLCASKIPDAQAAYESAQTLVPTIHAGTNFVLHAAGWMEGGLASSYEKFVMDTDQLGMMHVLARGIDLSENGQGMAAFQQVAPGGHFLGCEHTQANFEKAFYRSIVADNNSVEQWEAEGRLDEAQRANALWKKMLAEYEAPAIDPGVDEALRAFIEQKKASMPDATH